MSEKKKVTIVNLITGSRIIGTFLLPVVTSIFGPLGTAIYIASLWATDAVDGYLAKHKWKVSTIFGANLDALSDKVLGIAILIYLSTFYPVMRVPLLFEFGIFATNFHYGKKGADVKSSKIGKVKTALLGIITALSILSTISLTSGLAVMIPALTIFISAMEAYTLSNYIHTNKKYLRTHKPKNDVSHLGFFETIKTIIKKLGDKNLYSPEYFKQHKNEPLLDMLLNKTEEDKENEINIIEKETSNDTKKDNATYLTIHEQNELKIEYDLTNKDLQILQDYMEFHNISLEEVKTYLDEYIKNVKINYRNPNRIEQFLDKQEKTKAKKK